MPVKGDLSNAGTTWRVEDHYRLSVTEKDGQGLDGYDDFACPAFVDRGTCLHDISVPELGPSPIALGRKEYIPDQEGTKERGIRIIGCWRRKGTLAFLLGEFDDEEARRVENALFTNREESNPQNQRPYITWKRVTEQRGDRILSPGNDKLAGQPPVGVADGLSALDARACPASATTRCDTSAALEAYPSVPFKASAPTCTQTAAGEETSNPTSSGSAVAAERPLGGDDECLPAANSCPLSRFGPRVRGEVEMVEDVDDRLEARRPGKIRAGWAAGASRSGRWTCRRSTVARRIKKIRVSDEVEDDLPRGRPEQHRGRGGGRKGRQKCRGRAAEPSFFDLGCERDRTGWRSKQMLKRPLSCPSYQPQLARRRKPTSSTAKSLPPVAAMWFRIPFPGLDDAHRQGENGRAEVGAGGGYLVDATKIAFDKGGTRRSSGAISGIFPLPSPTSVHGACQLQTPLSQVVATVTVSRELHRANYGTPQSALLSIKIGKVKTQHLAPRSREGANSPTTGPQWGRRSSHTHEILHLVPPADRRSPDHACGTRCFM
ncbi:hypothetical protein BDK51DRAFT_37825 [Blyttiomyces helicus]|uniref:Uncharacterized protein n=1 Tax=Blyttiomyces helicus TaxID=388810 RepID=A0A4P9WB77_9FUNG|nr:hypothetical protein BDK51DRAFT_37825 [Blyttiomyces helicus]|eukprot:RKO87526.1 hypothetical protein BDK51DRAFT_37825 [Blyttiomyces helicus]